MLDLQPIIYGEAKRTVYMSAASAGRHAVGLGYLSIDVLLEGQNRKYCEILYWIDYIAYGFHLWCKKKILKYMSNTYCPNILAYARVCTMCFLLFLQYRALEQMAASKILLRSVAVICLQFWEFLTVTQNREVWTTISNARIWAQTVKNDVLPAKAPPSHRFVSGGWEGSKG